MRPPVKIDTDLHRSPLGRYYNVGVAFDGGPWSWRKLKAKRSDSAKREAPQAVAMLMKEKAESLEIEAQELMLKATFLRTCARVKGVL